MTTPHDPSQRKPPAKKLKLHEKCAILCHNHKFMLFVLLVSVGDALLVATELTVDILAIKIQKEEVCDTKDIIKYLDREYDGQLDELFTNYTIDQIMYKIAKRNDHYYHHKRDLSAVNSLENERIKRAAPSGDSGEYGTNPMNSVLLFEVAHACRYGSIGLLSCMFLINIFRIWAMRGHFFHSKLMVLDAIVVVISLLVDIVFLPQIWKFTDATLNAIPIIIGLSWRIVRVVNNSLINLHEKDKILLARETARLQESEKRNRHKKHEIYNLRGLCRKLGAEETDITACSKLVKTIKKKRFSKSSLASGIMSVNSLAFLGTLSREKQPHEPQLDNLDKVDEVKGGDDGGDTLQRTGDYVRRNRKGSTTNSNKKWIRGNSNRVSTVSSIGSISMASSFERDLDIESLDDNSYERATETSDTDNDDSDERGSKSDKVCIR
ncbi:uncharacterized protein [Watersipora subatra]|uniref:uncharacterized protein isoform X2 n=1 Tax=Watersipora subatra TaxID=2589382 RepID=UPI00355AE723